MNKFILDINDQALIRNGKEATIDFYHTLAISELNLSDISAFLTGADSPFLNVVIDTGFTSTINEDILEQISNFFTHHNVPWSWLLTDISKKNQMEQNGLTLLEAYPSMYFDLNDRLPEEIKKISTIKEMVDDLSLWITPIHEGFGSNDNGEYYRQLNANLLKKGENKLKHFTAFYENDVAASATLFLSDNSVMIHNLATRPKYQKHGIGTELTLYLMQEAKNLGYKDCFLDASEDAFNLYKRLGFKIYCETLAYNLVSEKFASRL